MEGELVLATTQAGPHAGKMVPSNAHTRDELAVCICEEE